ncbi:MAG TPA: alpha/beta hydrolase [Microthrixaceae bacterium]|nr:alpha/beta hydrolase [Microthrixaceae bacterium]
MAVYVLVHGGWSGAHGFRHVRRRLAAAGHEVFTPSLTGIGERAHLASPMVNLSTHVRDVVNQVLYEDLSEIVLLGFSYGGFVITGALDHIAGRVRHLVYLDAFVPDDGETALGHTMGIEAGPATLIEDWLVPPPERTFDDPAEAAWMNARRTPHPIGCFTEPIPVRRPPEEFGFTRTYIKATLDPPTDVGADALARAGERAKASPAWRYRELSTTHIVPSNRPDELTAILLELDT